MTPPTLTPSPSVPQIALDIVKLVNVGNSPVALQHDLHGNVTIAPGATAIVPLNVALVNLGNPGARNEGRNLLRDREIERVNTLWGFYPGLMPRDERFLSMPTIEVFDLNDNRIWMIHDDPNGTNATAELAEQIAVANDPDALLRQLQQLQEEKIAAARETVDLPESAQPKDVKDTSQSARNRLRDDIPEAPKDSGPTADKPRAPRSGR